MNNRINETDRAKKADLDDRLQEINQRLGRNIDQEVKERSRKRNSQGMALALRMASEFVSAILVGATIGYGIDWMLGSTPWVMIVFLLLGFVAGVINVMRSSSELSTAHYVNEEGNEGK